MKNLSAWDEQDFALFHLVVKNKEEGRKKVLNHPMLSRVNYVLYNGKTHSISEVYSKWPAVAIKQEGRF